jgi:hypothetical protein
VVVLVDPRGKIVWVSGASPGAVHNLTAAPIWSIIGELAAGLITLAHEAYTGAGDRRSSVPRPGEARLAKGRQPGPRQVARGASAPTPRSRPGRSCVDSAAVPGAGQLAKAIHVLRTRVSCDVQRERLRTPWHDGTVSPPALLGARIAGVRIDP